MPVAPDRILYEDQWLLAVDKLGGELVVKGKGRVDKLPLLDFLRKQYPGLAPIHRLDFETSGVVVFAKSRRVLATILEKKFSGWRKHYRALVIGTPKLAKGVIDERLPARSGDGKVAAETTYNVIETIGPVSLVALDFERGQRHQIRRHMALIHHPLILDEVYGNPKANRALGKFLKLHRFFLHASSIIFPHPVTGKTVTVCAPIPRVFEMALKKLRSI
jgi:RluA family pseudouridine synthase